MKSSKKVVILMSLLVIGSLNAKIIKKKGTGQPIPQPTMQPRPQVIQPAPVIPTPQQPMVRNAGNYHVIPTDADTLRRFDLCPLFSQPDIKNLTAEQQLLAQELQQAGYTQEQIASAFAETVPPHDSVFNEQHRRLDGKLSPEFETREVERSVPCFVQLGRYNDWNRTLLQCKTLDQFRLQEHGFSVAMCGGLSLNNGRLIRNYVLTGNTQSLYNMHSIEDAAQFLRKLNIGDWLNAEVLRNNIVRLQQELGVDGINVSVVSTVSLFDSQLNRKLGFAVFDQKEFEYAQRVKATIAAGLQQNDYIHILIIGNEESVEMLGHYFCFAIIKVGNTIQYVVLDTIPSVYHLQAGSHERDRLMFVIENIERGNFAINVTNLRTRFLR
jgi:hypothetical protein